jgi:uncharacterized protein YbbC (DUF1343 family)
MNCIKKTAILAVMVLTPVISTAINVKRPVVQTGLEKLIKSKFEILIGKKVGLITNPTGIDHNLRSNIDILFSAPGVQLVALFSPEHGVRGDFAAGEQVGTTTDPLTNLPVYSLYGKTRKPTAEMLKGIDVLVYDIQDIGSRSYTYISTLGLAMEAAAENNIGFIVLDRPNPLGGIRMEGSVTLPEFTSFVSQFAIPYIHGLTVGELAIFLNEEGMLKDKAKCNLNVVKMMGWRRTMYFEDTRLPWVPSSPHIPQVQSTLFYPATGILGELYVASIGVGYTLPFQLVAAEWINADSLSQKLNALNLPGIIFRPVHYKPYYSVSQGKIVHGVQIHIINARKAPLSLVQFYILQEAYKLWPEKNIFSLCEKSRLSMFDKVCGTDKVRIEFTKNFSVDSILDIWTRDIPGFRQRAEKYFLYR